VVHSPFHGGGGKHVWDSEVCHLGADVGDLEVGMWRVDGWWWSCGSCRSLFDYVHVLILDIVILQEPPSRSVCVVWGPYGPKLRPMESAGRM